MIKVICKYCGKPFYGERASKYCENCKKEAYRYTKRLYYKEHYSIKRKRKKSITLTVSQWEELSVKLDKMGISYGNAVAKGLI